MRLMCCRSWRILAATGTRKENALFIGKRLRLRRPRVADATLIAEWRSDPEYWGPFYNVAEDTTEEWEQRARKEWERDNVTLLITATDSGEPVGMIGYWNPFTLTPFFRGLELWYQVQPSARGRGIATEATCILVNHLFNVRPIERLRATVAFGNDASCRVLEKAGMQRDGVYRGAFFLHGRYRDMHLYSIVRADWQSEDAYRETHDF
jgi:[ribosomal protein S5]-alanine N-acetyltransferase